MTGYAVEADLQLGDMLLSPKVVPQEFLDSAWVEIEAQLGMCYELPLPAVLTDAEVSFLTTMHWQLATGRLILAQAGATGSEDLAAYGKYIVDQARNLMDKACPCDGTSGMGLPSATITTTNNLSATSDQSMAPGIVVPDGVSIVEHYYANGESWSPTVWRRDTTSLP